jgi:hypothetical protein
MVSRSISVAAFHPNNSADDLRLEFGREVPQSETARKKPSCPKPVASALLSGAPAVRATSRRGFGSGLICNVVFS